MAQRDPTRLEVLRDAGRYIDYALQPSLNEVPGILSALLYGDDLLAKVEELRKDGRTDAEISHEVAHHIAPPDPDAGATIVQGVPPEQHQQLLDEVAQLREAVRELRGPAAQPAGNIGAGTPTQGQTTSNAPPISGPAQMTDEQQELQALREQVQHLRVQQAAGAHPTAESAPLPDEGPTPGDHADDPEQPVTPPNVGTSGPPNTGEAEH